MRITPRLLLLQYGVSALFLVTLGSPPVEGQPARGHSLSAVIRSGPTPGIRFVSGSTICDEELYKGHWVNRYWITTGQIKPEDQLGHTQDNDAFQLGIEGQDLAGTWRWVGATQQRVNNPDGLLVTFELASSVRPITVKVHTLLTGLPVMVRWLEVSNTGSKPTAITRISPWAGRLWAATPSPERVRPGEPLFEAATTDDMEVGAEGAWQFDSLGPKTKTLTAGNGVSGYGHPTFFAHNRTTGEWAVASLAWSSNWTMHLTGGNQLLFDIGPYAPEKEVQRVLDPGETVNSPETHLLMMRGDLDRVIQTLHEHVRRDILLPPVRGREYQVEANHRGYIIDQEDEPKLLREVDIAAAVGAEMFVVDAGWFGPRRGWSLGHGEWYPGPWLPHDLYPIRDHAHRKGMLFGLWAEIETVGPDARVGKAHPDWFVTRDSSPGGMLLDFSNPAVVGWVESEIARMIRQYDLDMFRLDYNLYVGPGGNRRYKGFTENTEWRHVQALYSIFDRLHRRFPHVIFQNCANGGGRLDYGMMHRFHNAETSESMRPPGGLKALNGMTWVLPPEILLRTLGTENDDDPQGSLESDGDIDLQLRHIMMGRPIFRGISPTLDELDPDLGQKIRAAVEFFKRTVRPIMVNSVVYHHTPVTPRNQPVPWVVLEYATPVGDRDVVGLFRTSLSGDPVYRFMPRGLDFSRTYRVHFGNSGRTVEMSGAALLQNGVPVRLENMLTSEMLVFEAK